MIKVILSKVEFPPKDMSGRHWTSDTGRSGLSKSGFGGGFYKPGYSHFTPAKPGYAPMNAWYDYD